MFYICELDQIKDGSLNRFEVDKKEILIGKINGKLFACDNNCPHRGASMHKGYFKENNVVCYMHGYEFDMDSGKLTNMKSWKKSNTWLEQHPNWRKSGDLKMYNIFIDDGKVYVTAREQNNNKTT